MVHALQWLCLGVMGAMIAGTLINLHPSPHWFVRGWDFPRIQIASLLAAGAAPYFLFFAEWRPWEIGLLLATSAALLQQLRSIVPYTPLWSPQVVRSRLRDAATLRIAMSNVEMQNREFDRWRRVVEAARPDVILALECDEAWAEALAPMKRDYPHHVFQPQDNCYGMILLSKLELVDPKVRFIVQEDIPSIHTDLVLRDGQRVHMVAVHPRPPEPIRDQDATPRDAELVSVGKSLKGTSYPNVIAGDLNDVAWSRTTGLFLRISGLLDPRRGRGMFNSWNARNPLFRFPLDHVFHSPEFRLVQLRRLDKVGSDHFPMLIELSYEPDAVAEQPEPEKKPTDEAEAQEKIEAAEEQEGKVERV